MAAKDPMKEFDVSPVTNRDPFSRMSREARDQGIPTIHGSGPSPIKKQGADTGAIRRQADAPILPAYEQEIENLKSIGAEWPRIDREYSRTFQYLEGIQDNMELQRMEDKRQSDLATYGQIG